MSIAWISHRGESIDAPENTLSAFKLSSARDVDGMECDIYFTSDKVVVCVHDSHTERTSQGVVKAEIPGTPFAELEKINVWKEGLSCGAYPEICRGVEDPRCGPDFLCGGQTG